MFPTLVSRILPYVQNFDSFYLIFISTLPLFCSTEIFDKLKAFFHFDS
jgi:hypothetical protein